MDTVNLPDLATLRDRWRTLAIVYHACGLPDIWATSVTFDNYIDPGGSGLELHVLRSRAAVLTGFDADLLDKHAWADPALLVDGAPPWAASAVEEFAPLGDAAWWDGTGWYRSSAARGRPRSVEVVATPLLGVGAMVDELIVLLDDPVTGAHAAATGDERALALRIVTERPTAEALIRLYDGRRYGFLPEHARAAVAEHS